MARRREAATMKRANKISAYEKVWRWSGGDWRIGRARKDQGTRGMGQPAGLKRLSFMLRVKGSDSLCPLGPGLVTDWDFHGKRIKTRVNGAVAQSGNTDEMIWDMHYLVADIARTITLEPGDVILSGTPANSRPVEPGDVVEVEVEGLGVLRNTIVEGSVPVLDDVGAQPSESEEVISTALGGDWKFRGVRAPRKG